MNKQMLQTVLLVLTISAAAGCDSPTRVSTPTTPTAPPAGAPTGHPSTWRFTMEPMGQTPSDAEVCGRILSDTWRSEGRVQIHQTGSSIDIGCFDGDEVSFGTCLRGRVEGDTIVATGRDTNIGNSWCQQYRVFHDIDWTLEAVVESETAIGGTIAGRFRYDGGGQVIEIHRVWTLLLRR